MDHDWELIKVEDGCQLWTCSNCSLNFIFNPDNRDPINFQKCSDILLESALK